MAPIVAPNLVGKGPTLHKCERTPTSAEWVCTRCNRTTVKKAAVIHKPVCKTCWKPSNHICSSCGTGIHYKSECRNFSTGVDSWYAVGAQDIPTLCPDCWSLFAIALKDSTVVYVPVQKGDTVDAAMKRQASKPPKRLLQCTLTAQCSAKAYSGRRWSSQQ